MAKYKVNKNKCLGCGLCTVECPEGIELTEEGKAKVIDSKKVDDCGGQKICPYGAIEKEKNSFPQSFRKKFFFRLWKKVPFKLARR